MPYKNKKLLKFFTTPRGGNGKKKVDKNGQIWVK